MKTTITLLTALLIALPAVHAAKPNILIILADDMGYADIGVHGCKDILTPNIDRIATRGVRFTDAYANGAFCTPTSPPSSPTPKPSNTAKPKGTKFVATIPVQENPTAASQSASSKSPTTSTGSSLTSVNMVRPAQGLAIQLQQAMLFAVAQPDEARHHCFCFPSSTSTSKLLGIVSLSKMNRGVSV